MTDRQRYKRMFQTKDQLALCVLLLPYGFKEYSTNSALHTYNTGDSQWTVRVRFPFHKANFNQNKEM